MNQMGETFLQQKNHGFQSVSSCPQTYKDKISNNTAVRFNCAKCYWHIGVLFAHFFVCQSTFSKFVWSISPQLATRLLAHKIQSPQEWEAMQALTVSGHPSEAHAAHVPEMHWHYEWKNHFKVLETCMKNGGKRFCSEVGKFRFLNELIKVVSPKVMIRVLLKINWKCSKLWLYLLQI